MKCIQVASEMYPGEKGRHKKITKNIKRGGNPSYEMIKIIKNLEKYYHKVTICLINYQKLD